MSWTCEVCDNTYSLIMDKKTYWCACKKTCIQASNSEIKYIGLLPKESDKLEKFYNNERRKKRMAVILILLVFYFFYKIIY